MNAVSNPGTGCPSTCISKILNEVASREQADFSCRCFELRRPREAWVDLPKGNLVTCTILIRGIFFPLFFCFASVFFLVGLSQTFSDEAMAQARAMIESPPPDPEASIRRDLTHLKVYAIDSEDTNEVRRERGQGERRGAASLAFIYFIFFLVLFALLLLTY